MDRIIEKKKGWRVAFTKKAWLYWCAAAISVFVLYLFVRPDEKVLRVDGNALSTGSVTLGEFNDYIRVNGRVQPMVTIQLSPLEGGIVKEILVEEGAEVKAGEPLLVLSNDNLDLQILNSEAELAEKENILRNTLISMEQQKLSVRQEQISLAMELKRNERAYSQQKALYEEKLIAREEYLKAEEDFFLVRQKYELIKERAVQDSLYRGVEINQMKESLSNMRLNMSMIRARKASLTVKAPIDGVLGLLDAVLGQNIPAGTRIGQINSEGKFKIESQIDEHYIDRVLPGLEATFERGGERFAVQVRKVYPEVREGRFQADLKFTDVQPENIRTGQTYYLDLQLGQAEEAVLIPRGPFYQKTGGRWIYVLSAAGKKAVKRNIRIGRQNPQFYEVLEGLTPGEQVVISSYDTYGESDVIVL